MSTKGLISEGFRIFKEQKSFFIKLLLLESLVLVAESVLESFIFGESEPGALYNLFTSFLSTILGFINIKASLAALNGEKLELSAFISTLWENFGGYLLATIYSGIKIFIGFLLLIVPGIIWSFDYALVPYLAIQKKMKAGETLAESKRLMRGNRMDLFGLGVLLGLLNLGGLLALLVGLFVTIPVSGLAMAMFYKRIVDQPTAVPASISVPPPAVAPPPPPQAI